MGFNSGFKGLMDRRLKENEINKSNRICKVCLNYESSSVLLTVERPARMERMCVCVAEMNVQCIRRVEKAFYDLDIKCEAWVLLGFAELYLISKKNMHLLMKRKGNIKG